MSDLQKRQIKDMRVAGHGYKAIATNVGLSRDAVRQYCKSNGLGGFLEVVKLNMEIHQNYKCKYCSKTLYQKPKVKTKIFCCKECCEKWWAENAHLKNKTAIYKFTCQFCKCEFESYGNKNRKYCSHGCFIKNTYYREENKK